MRNEKFGWRYEGMVLAFSVSAADISEGKQYTTF